MRAAVAGGNGQPFVVTDVEIAEPIGREALIEIRASGLCHSDILQATTDFGLFEWPAVLGHEIAGVVTQVGPEVTDVAVGDHVAACLVQFCGTCTTCTSGRTYECQRPERTLRSSGQPPRLARDGQPLTQGFGLGGFAEQALVHENQLAVINKDVPFAAAALLGCAVVTGMGSVINAARVRPGDTVVVIGTGGVGLNAISGASVSGAVQIVAVDIDDVKLEAARRFGATDVVNARTSDAVAAVRAITRGGADHAFEVIGNEDTQAQAYAMTGQGGTAYFVGVAKPGSTVTVDSSLGVLHQRKNLSGLNMGHVNLKRDIPLYAKYFVQGRLNLDDLVTQEIALHEINDAYESIKKGGIIRSVITTF